jgi:hypothetical protein
MDIDVTVFDSTIYVINQVLVAAKDGKLSYEDFEKIGKLLYRLNNILTIYMDKKKRNTLTKDEFMKFLTEFVSVAKGSLAGK